VDEEVDFWVKRILRWKPRKCFHKETDLFYSLLYGGDEVLKQVLQTPFREAKI
jgi:hypothetical protein